MASIKDIAKACGVSVATVSKALNGHNDISQATKEKVREAARQLGYMPNSAARALKTNRTYNLGVLFVDEAQSGLTHEFFAAVLDSFKRHAEGRGYDITFINHNIGHGHSSYLEHCRYRGVDGVIAACVQFDDPEVVELAYSNLPLVTVDHVFNNRAAVLSDNVDGIRKLVDQLTALGHERIAYIHGEQHSAVTQKRLVGFYRACAAHGITVPDEYVIPGTYRDAIGCAKATRQLLSLPLLRHRRHPGHPGGRAADPAGHLGSRLRRQPHLAGHVAAADHLPPGHRGHGQGRRRAADRGDRIPPHRCAGAAAYRRQLRPRRIHRHPAPLTHSTVNKPACAAGLLKNVIS